MTNFTNGGTAAPNPFDPDALRLSQDFLGMAGVKKELTTARAKKMARPVRSRAPYGTGPDTLFVAFFASAELGCHRVLGWDRPAWVLDLFTEFRDRFNGLGTLAGKLLLVALPQFCIYVIEARRQEVI